MPGQFCGLSDQMWAIIGPLLPGLPLGYPPSMIFGIGSCNSGSSGCTASWPGTATANSGGDLSRTSVGTPSYGTGE